MRVEKLFESRFMRAVDLNGKPWTGTIAALRVERLEGSNGVRPKGIIKFSEWPEKEFVLNRTNLVLTAAMFGPETDAWINHKLTIHPVIWQGEELALRVKGSPDLPKAMEVELKLPRKKAVMVRLEAVRGPGRPAGSSNGKAKAPEQPANGPTNGATNGAAARIIAEARNGWAEDSGQPAAPPEEGREPGADDA